MTPSWKETLGAAGAQFNATRTDEIDAFGDSTSELAAARDATVVVPLTHLGVIRVRGEDAKSFLHNQLTSDINHLDSGSAQHSAWCSPKGRMLVSFVIWREGDDYLLALSADLLATIAKRLQMYVLRAKVTVADISNERCLLGVAGPQAPAVLAAFDLAPPPAMKTAVNDEVTAIHLDPQRFLVALPVAVAVDRWSGLVALAHPAGLPAWRWLDIRAAMPIVCEATKEHFVPQMANFDRLGGVSFHKGCYPGQEIVARTQYLGKVKRHLYRLKAGEPMAAGDELYSPAVPDQSCGMVVSGAPSPAGGFEALAVLMETAADAGVHLRSRDGAATEARAVAA